MLRRKVILYQEPDSLIASDTGEAKTLPRRDVRQFAGRLLGTFLAGTNPTLDAKIQTSVDGTGDWKDFITFTQAGVGSIDQLVHVDPNARQPFPYFRAVLTLGGTDPEYRIDGVELWYDIKK